VQDGKEVQHAHSPAPCGARNGAPMMQVDDSPDERRGLAALVVLGAALIALSLVMLQLLEAKQYERFVGAALIQCALYAAAVWLVARRKRHGVALAVVLGIALFARAIALLAPDTLSTDIYRYVWDGRVQAAGINPYRHVPADPALAFLRDEQIYPHINRADYAPTAYPPAAQMIFFLVTRIQQTAFAIKLAMAGFEAVTIAAILAFLRIDGVPPERVLIYAWHPLPIWEFAGAGHIDAAAIAFLCLAVLAAMRGRAMTVGAALAFAALVKPFALVLAPALWKKWDFRLPAAFACVALVCYAPYLAVGPRVLGFLGEYAGEEGYFKGDGFFLVTLLRSLGVPIPAGMLSAIIVLAILAALAAFIALQDRREPVEPWAPVALATAFLVLVSPHFAWYFAWLLPLLCRRLYVPALYLTLACFLLYLPEIKDWADYFKAGLWLYGGFAILALGDGLMRIPQLTARRPA
jgi:alpha-1,6-mannosyltransferase